MTARLVAGSTPAKVRRSFIRKDDDAAADLAERQAVGAQLRLPQDVVPERRTLVEAVRFQLPQLVGRQLLDAHRFRDVLTRREAPGQLAQEVALRQCLRRVVARDRAEREIEERRRDHRVDLLVRLHLPVAEVEERLPADEAPRGASTAAQVDRIGLPLARGVEDHPEEGVAVVALEIGAVRRPHHAVTEPIRRRLELHGNEAFAHARPVEKAAVPQHVVHRRLPDDQRQVRVEDDPMVVPCRQLAPLLESGVGVAVDARPIDRVVVEEDERALEAGDHQVLVVARVGDDRRVVRVSRQILEQASRLDPELRPVDRLVQLRSGDRTRPVDGVEVERRRPRVRRAGGVGGNSHR